MEQVLASVQLQRLKLFDRLAVDVDKSACHASAECCSLELSDEELDIVDDSITNTIEVNPDVAASLYFVCGYIAFKEKEFISLDVADDIPESEFTVWVSRGGLAHPTQALFGFAKSCFLVFTELSAKQSMSTYRCSSRFVKLFSCLGSVYPCDFYGKLHSVCHRLTNTFLKGFVRSTNENCLMPSTPQSSQRKMRKLNPTG